jgi:hypothetical protein
MNHDRPSMPKVTAIRGVVPPRRVSGRAARAHEEMNALSVISSVASLLAPGLSERDRVRMERLNRAVDRSGISFETMSTGTRFHCHSVPQPIDVEALVRGVCELLRERAEDAGIRIVVDCGGGLLDGDAAPLEETLFELVGNAIDATLPGRAVHLETRVTSAGDQVWTIQGSGAARPARLMLSASVAMSYGGSLAFESREGEGTTVRVWLPRVARKGGLPTLSSRTVRPVDVVGLRSDVCFRTSCEVRSSRSHRGFTVDGVARSRRCGRERAGSSKCGQWRSRPALDECVRWQVLAKVGERARGKYPLRPAPQSSKGIDSWRRTWGDGRSSRVALSRMSRMARRFMTSLKPGAIAGMYQGVRW